MLFSSYHQKGRAPVKPAPFYPVYLFICLAMWWTMASMALLCTEEGPALSPFSSWTAEKGFGKGRGGWREMGWEERKKHACTARKVLKNINETGPSISWETFSEILGVKNRVYCSRNIHPKIQRANISGTCRPEQGVWHYDSLSFLSSDLLSLASV